MPTNQSQVSLRIPDLANPIHRLGDEECLPPRDNATRLRPETDGARWFSWWGWLDELFEGPYLSREPRLRENGAPSLPGLNSRRCNARSRRWEHRRNSRRCEPLSGRNSLGSWSPVRLRTFFARSCSRSKTIRQGSPWREPAAPGRCSTPPEGAWAWFGSPRIAALRRR